MRIKLTAAVIFSFMLCISAFAQQTQFEKERAEADRAAREKLEMDNRTVQMQKAQENQISNFLQNIPDIKLYPESRRYPNNNLEPISEKEYKLFYKNLRAVNPEDLLEYKEFLEQPKTGIFRLFPNFDCDKKLIIKVDEDCAASAPHSWSYSFRRKNYVDEFFDIRMNNGSLIADSLFSQGILVDLGDVSLSDISADDSRVKFLTDFKPQKKFKGARSQFVELAKGITSGEYVYTKSVKTDVNTTYAARFIAYQPTYKIYHSNYSRVGLDKRTDLSIAFRIIRIDKDSSLTIVWKTLDQKDSPKLIFEKDDPLMDIKPENPNKNSR